VRGGVAYRPTGPQPPQTGDDDEEELDQDDILEELDLDELERDD